MMITAFGGLGYYMHGLEGRQLAYIAAKKEQIQQNRERVEQLLRDRRTAVLTDDTDGKVIFKADIGAMSGQVCQIQGVWVHPAYRGRGLAAPCMAAVVSLARTYVPVVSLYVNSYNRPALATYRKVGFERSGTFATVLL